MGAFLTTLMHDLAFSEEGARFPISMVSSGVWAGKIPLEKAHNLQEVGDEKQTMKQELERIGYLGTTESDIRTIPIAVNSMACDLFNRLKADCNGRHILNCILVRGLLTGFLYTNGNFVQRGYSK